MPIIQNEAQIQLALQAIKRDENLSLRSAAKLYSIPLKTLHHRHSSKPSCTESIPNSRNLDPIKEQVII